MGGAKVFNLIFRPNQVFQIEWAEPEAAEPQKSSEPFSCLCISFILHALELIAH